MGTIAIIRAGVDPGAQTANKRNNKVTLKNF